jgi:hypothetical protein
MKAQYNSLTMLLSSFMQEFVPISSRVYCIFAQITNNYYSLYCVLGFSLAKSLQIILGICRCLRYFQRKQ